MNCELLHDIQQLKETGTIPMTNDYLANEVAILWHNTESTKFKIILKELGFTNLKNKIESLDRNLLMELRDVFIGVGDIKMYRLNNLFLKV